MKIPALTAFLNRLLAAAVLLSWSASAQETATEQITADSTPAVAASAPAPAAAPAPESPTTPVAETAPTPAAAADEAPLRRLDEPAPAAAATPEVAPTAPVEPAPDAPSVKEGDDENHGHHRHSGRHANEKVSFGGNSVLGAGESADQVVSIFGSSTSSGTVHDAVVSILGSSTVSGDVGGAVVSVLGSSRVTGGRVGDAVVSVLGTTRVDAKVRGDVVAVFGNIELGPNAEVGGELVCVGGTIHRDDAAVVHGRVNNVAFGPSFGGLDTGVDWLQAWITQCAFLLRPLAFGPHLMWAWWIAIAFLGLYLLLALIFPRALEKCAGTLEQRPGYSILTAVLALVVAPVVTVLLCITLVGIAVVPFLGAALLFASIFGKAVMLTWIGRCITRHIQSAAPLHAVVSTLIGGVIVLLLYTVPVLGLIVYKLLGFLGLGVVIFTLILGSKRKAAPPAAAFAEPAASGSGPGVVPGPAPMTSPGFGSPTTGAVIAALESRNAGAIPPPIGPSAATAQRAGFWIRLGASVIDCVIVVLAVNLLPDSLEPNFLFAFAVYCVVLWALKGTTIGGIICNLKVVRVDERPMDWPTALVRGLAGFLSLVAAGLGFVWVAFDDQKQSWHDKIAGTTIVQVPRGVPLV